MNTLRKGIRGRTKECAQKPGAEMMGCQEGCKQLSISELWSGTGRAAEDKASEEMRLLCQMVLYIMQGHRFMRKRT